MNKKIVKDFLAASEAVVKEDFGKNEGLILLSKFNQDTIRLCMNGVRIDLCAMLFMAMERNPDFYNILKIAIFSYEAKKRGGNKNIKGNKNESIKADNKNLLV
jgi:hypothetical protein